MSDVDWLMFWGALIGMMLCLPAAVGALASLPLPFVEADPL
jgi:hypothetical protein